MLTETKLRSLKPASKTYRIADGLGLSIEVQPGGASTWVYRYRFLGKQQPIRLGRYPDVTLVEARAMRAESARLVSQGVNPALVKQQAKRDLSRKSTVEQFSAVYLAEVVKRDRKNPAEVERYFRREILPQLGSVCLADVTPDQILKITDRMKKRGVPMAALALRNLLKRFFDFAMARQLISFNPAAAIPAKVIASPKRRSRALKAEEIKVYLEKLYESNIARRYKLALHLILLTMVRKSELTNARWLEFNLKERVWEIPESRTKKSRSQNVYLSAQAMAILNELKELAEGSEWLLPGRNNPRQPIQRNTLNAAMLSVAFGIEHFTIHDSRRTASTILHEIGWESDVIEKALGHEMGGVRGIYNRAEYAEKRRDMLQQWADYIDGLMTERKVVLANFGSGRDGMQHAA